MLDSGEDDENLHVSIFKYMSTFINISTNDIEITYLNPIDENDADYLKIEYIEHVSYFENPEFNPDWVTNNETASKIILTYSSGTIRVYYDHIAIYVPGLGVSNYVHIPIEIGFNVFEKLRANLYLSIVFEFYFLSLKYS